MPFKIITHDAVMIGNLIKSDILPPLAYGAAAIRIPHGPAWTIGAANTPVNHPRFHRLKSITELPEYLPKIR